jgi:hypothetical protein
MGFTQNRHPNRQCFQIQGFGLSVAALELVQPCQII